MNPKHLHICRHALGLDGKGHGQEYRNHFVTGPGCNDWEACQQLVAEGLMADHGASAIWGEENRCFTVTEEGKKAVRALAEPLPKLTRAKQRYQDYLASADCFESFMGYLKYCARRGGKGAA